MNDRRLRYIEDLLALIQKGRPDPLRDVLTARLSGDTKEHHELTSPTLGRDEPDHAALLFIVCDRLKANPDSAALTYFRRVLFDLIETEFNHDTPDGERVTTLAHLAAYCRLVDDPELAPRLQRSLWGLLSGYLGSRLPELPSTHDAGTLRRAELVLDLWLTVTPPNLGTERKLSGHLVDDLAAALDSLLIKLETGAPTAWENLRLVQLLFRAVMKTNPRRAGHEFFWRLCAVTYAPKPAYAGAAKKLRGAWMGLCWEYGEVFHANTDGKDWGRLFFMGLEDRIPDASRSRHLPPIEAVRAALEYFGEKGAAILHMLKEHATTSGINNNLIDFTARKSARAKG